MSKILLISNKKYSNKWICFAYGVEAVQYQLTSWIEL